MEAQYMKKIKIIEMGGTISARGLDRLDLKDYQTGVYTGEDFLGDIPEIADVADIEFDPFIHVSSTEVNTAHWVQLRARIIRSLLEEDFDGIVVTHGTNTIEETAYFLHLTIPSEKPVVVVGSQRPYTALSSDAQLNLVNAVRVAASDEAIGKGVLVVLNDEINSAREVTKSNTYRLETFQSGQLGLLGYVDPDDCIVFYRETTRKHTLYSAFSSLDFDGLPEVEITYSYAGATRGLIDAVVTSGNYAGIVTAGTGAGLISPSELAGLRDASNAGLIVVRSSRVGNGRVLPVAPYEKDNFVSADNLLPQKARILLMLSLLKHSQSEDIQRIFDTY